MERLNIPVFSGQGTTSINSRGVQGEALISSSSSAGGLLLSSCFEAFHSELSSLSAVDLEMTGVKLPDFDRPSALLVVSSEKYYCNPVISGSRLFLIQTLIYLEWATRITEAASNTFATLLERNRRYGIGLIGFSSGIITACVAGTSATILDFLSNAVSAFRVALWIGVRTQYYRSRTLATSGFQQNDNRSWSCVLFGIGRRAAEEAISQFCLRDGGFLSLHVTVVHNERCITVSGRPDILSSFVATLPETVSAQEASVCAMYHSPVHNDRVRGEVLADLRRRKIRFPSFSDIIFPIRSTFTGQILEEDQRGSLLEFVVDMIVIQPVNWDKVKMAVAQSIPEDEIAHLINIGPGTGLVRSVEKALRRGGSVVHYLAFEDRNGVAIPEPAEGRIAVIGMAVNMPGAPDVSKLWEILEQGINTVSEVPNKRFRVDDYTTGQHGRSMKARTGNFLDDVDKFDNEFFNISPREARSMDPQMRILLHTAYEALEDSGYVPNVSKSFNPETFGCYVGAATGDYVQNLRHDIDVYYSTGTLRAFLSGRISYAMGFGGPSIVVDTACSSSLVAIYQACRSLLNGDCSAALAGGVNVIASPDMFIGLDRGHFLSPAGQCKVFDASADGYSRGEGCGLFVLKRLSDAQAENDRILGVIRGVQVNQSGTARSITQPDVTTQVQLFRRLLERSGVAPEDVNVLEAHGTGTQSGDVSEIESVRRVFTPGRAADNRLHITSVKANIGHLEAASGAAGLAKLLLMLQHRIIPPLISLVNLNPKFSDLGADHTLIDTERQPWNHVREGLPRMALLNNFGAAGSNAALLLEEFIPPTSSEEQAIPTGPYIFGLSAKTEAALVSMRAQLIDWLDSADFKNVSLCDIAYSLTARRQIYQHRMSLTAATRRELVNGLQSNLASVKVARQDGKVAFVFSGQGGQYLGMGNSLYKSVPLFQSIIDKCHSFLVKAGFPGIVQLIGCEQDYCKSLEETDLEGSHSAIFALEYGLSQLWISWGINPALVVGHSLGEYVAQAVAGVLTLQDALILVAGRARLMVQKCVHDSTGMMAVNLSAVVIGNILASSERFSAINIACYNSPDDHVVSGPVAGLQALKSYLGETVGCKTTLISASFGYHSDAMRPLQDDLILLAQHTPISPPVIPMISNVYGEVVLPGDASVFNPQYYSRHCTEPVFFEQGIRAFVASRALPAIDAWIEIGPHPTILPALRKHPVIQEGALFLASMRKLKHPLSSLYSALAQLYNSPCRVNWQKVFARWPLSSNTSLPTYPWSKTSFWVRFEEEKPPAYKVTPVPVASKESPELPYAVLGARVQVPFSRNGRLSVYETPISHLFKLICGHRVRGKPLCPASIYQELALAAVEASVLLRHSSLDSQVVVLHDADFLRPLVYSEDTCHTIQASIVFETGSTGSWKIESTGREGKNSETHTQGNFQLQLSSGIISKFNTIQPIISHGVTSLVSKRDCKTFTTTGVYQVFFPRVVTYGKDFHAIQTLTISADDTEGYAVIKIPDNANRDRFVVHPVLMDAMLHVAGFIANTHGKVNDALICTKVGCLEVLPRLIDSSTPHCVYVQCSWLPEGDMLAESYVLEPGLANLIVARVKGIFFRKMPLATLEHGLAIAAAATSSAVTPILPQLLEPKNATTPFGLSRPLPCSQQLFEVQEEAARSVSGSLLGPVSLPEVSENLSISPQDTKPGGAVAELVGEDVETVCGTGSPDVSLSSGILAGQFPFLDDDVYQSDVKTLLAAVLGLEVEELREDADLESLGLDSLASIEAHHALQSHFAIALPSDLFVAHKSVKAVYSFITGRLCTSLKHVNVSMDFSPTRTGRLDIDTLESPRCLDTVPILVQSSDVPGRAPLFLVHDGSGLVKYIHNLSSLGRDLWGIHNPHFISSQPWESVVSMATEYAKYTSEATRLGPVLLGGWSFGGIIAFEVARRLLKSGVAVSGVVLIDSPSPLNHVPLSDALIDSILRLGSRHTTPSNTGLLVRRQFQMNSRMLLEYDPTAGSGPYPRLVLLHSRENYCPGGGLDVPDWLSKREDRRSAVAGWETIVGVPVKCIDIPGHHFQPFHSSYISFTSSAIAEACSFLESAVESAEC